MNSQGSPDYTPTTFGQIAKKLVNGGTPPTEIAQFWNGKIPWITGADFTTSGIGEFRRFVSEAAVAQTATNLVDQGQLLLVTRTGVGKLAIAPCDIAISQDITGVHPDTEKVDVRFLYHRMRLGVEDLKKLNQGTSINGIIRSDLLAYRIELPPLPQQRRIAEILSTLDEAIEQTEALIAKHQQIKAGLMHDLFTRGVTPDGYLRSIREQAPDLYRKSPLGWIPKEWQYELLDELAVRGSGHTPSKDSPEYWSGGIKWISLADSYRLDRLYIDDTEYEISQLGIQNSSAVMHPAGVVVLSRDAGVGKSAITTRPMTVSQHFMCWRCDNRLNKYFLYYWLQFKKRMFENIAMGSTILTIGLPYFKRLKIAAPKALEEQKMIGDSLRRSDEIIFSLEADLEKKKQQKQGLMHDLLTGRVRVQERAQNAEVSP